LTANAAGIIPEIMTFDPLTDEDSSYTTVGFSLFTVSGRPELLLHWWLLTTMTMAFDDGQQ